MKTELNNMRHKADRRSNIVDRRSRGFTLIETAMTIAIVSMAVLAMVAAQQAYHRQNYGAAERSTGMMLANEIRELALEMQLRDPIYGTTTFGPETGEDDADVHVAVQNFDDLDDFASITFDGPINALRQEIPNMTGWSQVVTAVNVDEDDVSGSAVGNHTSDMIRMSVSVQYKLLPTDTPYEVSRLTWVSAGQP